MRSRARAVLSVLEGAGHDPRVVAAARGLLLAVATAALDYGVGYFQGPGASLAAAPVIVLALRYGEGVIDKRKAR